jgi:hypothetical protein
MSQRASNLDGVGRYVNYKLERASNKEVMPYFAIISRRLATGTEENHDISQSGYPVSNSRSELWPYRI